MSVSGAGLFGGKTGTSPQVVSQTRRNFTTNLFVDPVDYRWMNTHSDKPNVRVQVSGIPSACNTDCTYEFIDIVPTVTSMSLSGEIVAFTLSNTGSLTSTVNDTTVMIDGKVCSITNKMMPLNAFECYLPVNTDSTPILTAGDHMPTI